MPLQWRKIKTLSQLWLTIECETLPGFCLFVDCRKSSQTMPCFQCENTSASASLCCWGTLSKLVQEGAFFSEFLKVLFIYFCKGNVPSFLPLCIFLPPAVPTWAGLWLPPLSLHWAAQAASTRLGQGAARCSGTYRIPLSSKCWPGEHREKLSVK